MKFILILFIPVFLLLAACTDTRQNENPLRGIWAAVGEENATFVIDKDSINYPDHGAAYKYTHSGDSIHIYFDGFTGNYLVKMKGTDTLVLTGDDQEMYYRIKSHAAKNIPDRAASVSVVRSMLQWYKANYGKVNSIQLVNSIAPTDSSSKGEDSRRTCSARRVKKSRSNTIF